MNARPSPYKLVRTITFSPTQAEAISDVQDRLGLASFQAAVTFLIDRGLAGVYTNSNAEGQAQTNPPNGGTLG